MDFLQRKCTYYINGIVSMPTFFNLSYVHILYLVFTKPVAETPHSPKIWEKALVMWWA